MEEDDLMPMRVIILSASSRITPRTFNLQSACYDAYKKLLVPLLGSNATK